MKIDTEKEEKAKKAEIQVLDNQTQSNEKTDEKSPKKSSSWFRRKTNIKEVKRE